MLKTKATDSVHKISLLFIERTFSTEKRRFFQKFSKKWKLIRVYKFDYEKGKGLKTKDRKGKNGNISRIVCFLPYTVTPFFFFLLVPAHF